MNNKRKSMKKCPYCGAELSDESLFCTECGKELPKGTICPHCGASVNDGDTFCTECGKRMDEAVLVEEPKPVQQEIPPIEEVEEIVLVEFDEQPSFLKRYLPLVIGGIVVLALVIGFFVWNNSKGVDSNQQIATVDSLDIDSNTTDESEEIQARIKYIENFYKNLESSNWDAFVRNNVDANAHRTLNQAYDYECESDDCLAIWLFTKGDCSDPGAFISRNIKMKDIDTYLVENEYENVKYIVSLTLHKYGDIYKISNIEEFETTFIERHSRMNADDVVDTLALDTTAIY